MGDGREDSDDGVGGDTHSAGVADHDSDDVRPEAGEPDTRRDSEPTESDPGESPDPHQETDEGNGVSNTSRNGSRHPLKHAVREQNGRSRHTRTDPAQYVTDRRSLSPMIQVLWAVRAGLTALILGLVAAFILRGLDRDPRVGAVVVVGVMLLGTVWVVLHYRIWVYQVRDDAIYLERGVFTHVRTLVPYVRIQHVDTSRGPVERLLGLSTLVVYTAGSRGADVSIPGLTPDQARDLQQRVKQLAIEAEGGDAL